MDNFLRDKKMKNIVLIGASNSRVPGGLQAGLDQDDVKFFNLSVGGTGSLYGVYAVNRYYSILEQADLIILENHMIDHILITDCDAEIDVIFRDIFWLYESISKFKKKVLILFLPETRSQSMFYEKIKHITLYLCNLYGFNFIDIYKYMKIRNILDFYLSYPNSNHQINTIMYNLGINISKNIKYLRNSKISSKYPIPNFSIWYPNTDQQFFNKDLIYREKVCIISDKKEYFPSEYADCVLLGIHTWTGGYYKELRNKKISKNLWNVYSYSSLKIQNCNQCIVKCFWTYNTFTNIYQRKFMVDSNTYFCFNKEQLPWSEKTLHLQKIEGLNSTLNYVGISAFLLADQSGKFDFSEEIELIQNENIVVDSEYDFTHLVPPVEDYKTAIEEYNIRMDPIKLQPLQNQISILNSTISSLEQNKIQLSQEKDKIQQDNIVLKQTLNSLPIKKQQLEISNLEQDLVNKKLQTKQLSKKLGIKMNDFMPKITMISPSSAKARIQNQLSYKLGQAMIVNSKSILGYIRMPFVLSYIKDKHKQEQKIYQEKIKKDLSLKLPPLEDYPDYQEALKEKECLTYKLGQALIQANKTWYGGGYIKLWFEIRKLKKKFKSKEL